MMPQHDLRTAAVRATRVMLTTRGFELQDHTGNAVEVFTTLLEAVKGQQMATWMSDEFTTLVAYHGHRREGGWA